MEMRTDHQDCPCRRTSMEKIIGIFNDNNVRYLLMEGQALRLLGMPRFTMDWDILIPGEDLWTN